MMYSSYQFESFVRQPPGPQPRQPRVTLYRSGTFGFNRPTFERLGEPRALRFLYDPSARAIGLQASTLADPDAYRIAKRTTSNSYSVRAQRFLRYYAIPCDPPLEWSIVREHQGVLILHLADAVTLAPTRPA
jgi:hypothetical protein